MIDVPKRFAKQINVIYPPNNLLLFEEWFSMQNLPETEREYLPIQWTAYYVNNNYGQDKVALKELQDFLYSLPTDKRYYTIHQYDDGILNDVGHLDLLQFSMSKNIGYQLPLLSMPHPYQFDGSKLWFGNFIGSRTHPLRNKAEDLIRKKRYYISYDNHPIEKYCEIISKSLFTLCYRGYGCNSFRIAESMQYGSIPVYISDEFILPHGLNFNEFGVLIKEEDVDRTDEILLSIPYVTTRK